MEHLIGASFGQALPLPTNITIGWKGFAGKNALAYWSVKSFITLAPCINVTKRFSSVIYEFSQFVFLSVRKKKVSIELTPEPMLFNFFLLNESGAK